MMANELRKELNDSGFLIMLWSNLLQGNPF